MNKQKNNKKIETTFSLIVLASCLIPGILYYLINLLSILRTEDSPLLTLLSKILVSLVFTFPFAAIYLSIVRFIIKKTNSLFTSIFLSIIFGLLFAGLFFLENIYFTSPKSINYPEVFNNSITSMLYQVVGLSFGTWLIFYKRDLISTVALKSESTKVENE